jgi:hypothetical protein
VILDILQSFQGEMVVILAVRNIAKLWRVGVRHKKNADRSQRFKLWYLRPSLQLHVGFYLDGNEVG